MDPGTVLTVAIAGQPNTGKSTLFNALTGASAHVGNYPGVTIERTEAERALPSGRRARFIDVPGCYSLVARSPEEEIAHAVLTGQVGAAPDVVVCVVDGTCLARSLYLALQIFELAVPAIVCVNMMDEAQSQGLELDLPLLSARLGVPVLGISARKGQGLGPLLSSIADGAARVSFAFGNGLLRDLDDQALIQKRYQEIDRVLEGVAHRARAVGSSLTDRIDRVALHPIGGPVLFVAAMAVLFQAVYSWAEPLVSLVEWLIASGGDLVEHRAPPGALASFLVHGLLAGVGNVLVFVPQIALLFLGLILLEESGYLARGTVLLDRLMRAFGLPNKAFVPLMSSFACAVPGIMAARTIEKKSERLLTIMIAPLMSCSARLPVYVMVIGAVFTTSAPLFGFVRVEGLLMMGLYGLGFAAALAVAWLLRRTVIKQSRLPLVIELPPYRWPSPRSVAHTLHRRVRVFVTQTGAIILVISIGLWAAMTYPTSPEPATLAQALEHSLAGRAGKFIEPAIAPLGFDWRIGIGLLASLAAREVLVSTLGQVYALGSDVAADSVALRDALLADIDPSTGRPRFTPLVGLSLLVFFVLALQCMSTIATVKRETNSWRWPLFQFGYLNVLAYVASLVVFQGGRLLGFQ